MQMCGLILKFLTQARLPLKPWKRLGLANWLPLTSVRWKRSSSIFNSKWDCQQVNLILYYNFISFHELLHVNMFVWWGSGLWRNTNPDDTKDWLEPSFALRVEDTRPFLPLHASMAGPGIIIVLIRQKYSRPDSPTHMLILYLCTPLTSVWLLLIYQQLKIKSSSVTTQLWHHQSCRNGLEGTGEVGAKDLPTLCRGQQNWPSMVYHVSV